jgi:thiol-disulfide isomerase/thioredoxin
MERPTQEICMASGARPTAEMKQPSRRQVLAGCGALGGALLTGSARAADTPLPAPLTALKPRPPAPTFTLKGAQDGTYSLKQYQGKVVLINFWATWCPPCQVEMPSIERLYQLLARRDFVALALDQGEEQSAVFAFLGQLSPMPSFPVLLDQKSKVAHAFHVQGIPTTFLVDKAGHIAYKAVGGRNYMAPNIKDIVIKLIKE